MRDAERYRGVFVSVLDLDPKQVGTGLVYQGVPSWDSVGHMALIAAIEDEFQIELDVDDVIDFASFEIGLDILAKYGLSIKND